MLPLVSALVAGALAEYMVGVGIYDMTGPAADVNLMGYANPSQNAAGIHIRLRARTFIFGDDKKRVVYIAADLGMGGTLLRQKLLDKLKAKYGVLYNQDNVCLSGSHSHSTPAGWLEFTLFQVSSLGFIPETFDTLVESLFQSVVRAHDSLQPGSVSVSVGKCYNASVNRSPSSYLYNPPEERAMYQEDTDKDMVVLKLLDKGGKELGMLNWFAVHATSMNNTNRRISGDNKGYASMLFEAWKNGPGVRPGKGKFVAGFGQSNLGDISPNTQGAHCIDSGLPCDVIHSTCHGKNEMCIASGPGKDMMDSTRIIGETQFKCAKTLYEGEQTLLEGPVDYRHSYVNMTNIEVRTDPGGNVPHTCFPAMGYAFAAGTTDGPGMFDFTQGSNSSNPFWNLVASFLSKPTKEDIACHFPKPILLNTGKVKSPYDWDPQIVPVQIFTIGQLVIAAPPAEFTTMAGRRLKRLIKSVLGQDKVVVIAGLSSAYASYVTTFEEYQAQRYEAASTVYGPHTLTAYLQVFTGLANAIKSGTAVPPGPTPRDVLNDMVSLLPGVVLDSVPLGKKFGGTKVDVITTRPYRVGQEVTCTFYTGCPRNDHMIEKSFFYLEMLQGGEWVVVLDDSDWDTIFDWHRPHVAGGENFATFTWRIGQTLSVSAGTYRVHHMGVHKPALGKLAPFEGFSSSFTVVL